MLDAQHLSVRYGAQLAVDGVSLRVGAGEWHMIAGPNGAGKSTLLNAIAQGVPYSGTVLLDGQVLRKLRPAALAQRVGMLAQRHPMGCAYTVEEIVRLGRYAYRDGWLRRRDADGAAQVEQALLLTGMQPLRAKRLTELSGGEVQRAFLAQVFAQDPKLLLLDEPANHLDLAYQQQVFALIARWLKQPGRAVLSVVHDLSVARRYGTHALLMKKGRCMAQGPAQEALSRESLQAAYDMDVFAWMQEMLGQWTDQSLRSASL